MRSRKGEFWVWESVQSQGIRWRRSGTVERRIKAKANEAYEKTVKLDVSLCADYAGDQDNTCRFHRLFGCMRCGYACR